MHGQQNIEKKNHHISLQIVFFLGANKLISK